VQDCELGRHIVGAESAISTKMTGFVIGVCCITHGSRHVPFTSVYWHLHGSLCKPEGA